MQLLTSRIILINENKWLIYWDNLNISKDEVQNLKQLATLQINLTEKIIINYYNFAVINTLSIFMIIEKHVRKEHKSGQSSLN